MKRSAGMQVINPFWKLKLEDERVLMFSEDTVLTYTKALSGTWERPCAAWLWYCLTASTLNVWDPCGQESLFPSVAAEPPELEAFKDNGQGRSWAADPQFQILQLCLQMLEPHSQQTPLKRFYGRQLCYCMYGLHTVPGQPGPYSETLSPIFFSLITIYLLRRAMHV